MASSGIHQKPVEFGASAAPAPVTHPVSALNTTLPQTQTARVATPRSLAADAAVSAATLIAALGILFAPLAALAIAIWTGMSALISVWRLYTLAKAGQALTSSQTPILLHTLDIDERAGFLAVGYLALIFALITLMAGLFGRRWGRLFILPGAVFTATAVALLIAGLLFAAPLDGMLPVAEGWLIALAIYALIDAVLVSGLLVDASLTRSPTATGSHRAAPKTLSTTSGKRRAAPRRTPGLRPTRPTA